MIRVFQPWIFKEDYLSVINALLKKQISGTSSYVGKFENKFKDKFNKEYAVAVSNGSVALDLALESLNLNDDDEVILPSFTIVSCLSAVIRAGGKPIFCDVDINNWNTTLENVKKVFTKKTKAVLVVHTYGLPSEIQEIRDFCDDNNLVLIEDTAEAHGLKYNNKYCGTFGDISTFSFYANKHITSGEGGMVVTDNLKIYKRLVQMRNLDFDNSRRFVHENMFWNYRMGGLQAALGYSQISNLDRVIKHKQRQGDTYLELLNNHTNIFQLPKTKFKDTYNHFWVFGIVLKSPKIRDALIEKLYENGIETRPFFWPLHLQPFYLNNSSKNKVDLTNSEYIGNNGLYLPLGSHLNMKKQKYITNVLIEETKKLQDSIT